MRHRLGIGASCMLALALAALPALAAAQAPPPAPVMSPSRQEVLEILARPDIARCLPITLGTGAPTAILRREGARWVIRALTVDRRQADEARREALARDGSWMPEDEWALQRPGRILLEAPSQQELRSAIERMTDWTARNFGAERPPGPSRAALFCRG